MIKNEAGQVVRTIVASIPRSAGDVVDTWFGERDNGILVPEGPYFYVATVTAGGYSLTWDLSQSYWNNFQQWDDHLAFLEEQADPFNNRPLTFSYTFAHPGRVSLALSATRPVVPSCSPPNLCLLDHRYQEAGTHTVSWAGVAPSGALRTDIISIGVVSERTLFARNAVVVFGIRPKITNVRVNPPVYGPAVGSQDVTFDLTSFQSQPVSLQIRFFNQASLSNLRTITIPAQAPAPGPVTVTWDGRADNGMWVAPGFYTVTVEATDTLGNTTFGQILTTIQY